MRAVLLPLTLALAAPAAAQELDCSDPGGLSQQEMNACAWADYEAADAELNRVWTEAISAARRLGAGDELLEAQRAWLPFRDAACAAEAAVFEGGTLAPFLRATCLTRLTERRTKDLSQFADIGG